METAKPPKSKSRQQSVKVLNLICNKLIIKLACSNCYIDSTYKSNTPHSCNKTFLLAGRQKQVDNFVLVRKVPAGYEHGKMCDRTGDKSCPNGESCTFPHTEQEKIVWDVLIQCNWKMDAFLDDLKSTDLYLKHHLEIVLTNLSVNFVCKLCLKNKSYQTFRKTKNQPKCNADHKWTESNRAIVVDLNNGLVDSYLEISRKTNIDDLDLPEKTKQNVHILQNLIVSGYGPTQMEMLCKAVNQKQRQAVYNAIKSETKSLLTNKKYRTHVQPMQKKTNPIKEIAVAENVFDHDFADVLSDEDLHLSDIEFCYRRDYLKDIPKTDLYYEIRAHEDLQIILEMKKIYKLCKISLDGRQRATCSLLSEQGDAIEVKGRQNCGPTCEGDHVVVELKKKEIIDSKYGQERGKDEPMYGVVIGIMKQNTNRKACTFLCTVDEYFSHLMIPMCGTLPKVHVRNDEIRDHKDEIKNKKVCVYKKEGEQFVFQKVININCKDKQDRLFLVKYEKWEPTRMYPYGYVVKVIERGSDMITGQKVLNLMYQVPMKRNMDLEEICEAVCSKEIPEELLEGRLDCTQLLVFSIDPSGSHDIDDALSVTKLTSDKDAKDMYKVGIHIADVTAFIKQGDEIDLMAFRRKVSYYPGVGDQVDMLPAKLSRDLCSLKANAKRLALSLFVQMDSDGNLVSKPEYEFIRTIIENKRQLSYLEAENMIMETTNDDEIGRSITTLFLLSRKLKIARCKESSYYIEGPCLYNNDEYAPEAQSLIEEFMILANTYAAKHLEENYPGQAILRCQEPPNKTDIEAWYKEYKDIIDNSIYFKRFQNEFKMTEEITDECIHRDTMTILKPSYTVLDHSSKCNYFATIDHIVSTERLHPLIASSISNWYQIQHKATVGYTKGRHFSLQKECYTWFTSPIRRFVDIIVHRLIIASLSKAKKTTPYSRKYLEDFCCAFNNVLEKSKKYHKGIKLLKTACALKEKPIFMPAFIGRYDDDFGIEFQFPYLQHMTKRKREVNFSLCGVAIKPGIPDRKERKCKPYPIEDKFRLTWKKRIYDNKATEEYCRSKRMAKSNFVVCLNPKVHVKEVVLSKWKEVLDLLVNRQYEELGEETIRMIDASNELNSPIHTIFTYAEEGPYIHEYDEYQDEGLNLERRTKLRKARSIAERKQIFQEYEIKKQNLPLERISKRRKAEESDAKRREREKEEELRYVDDMTSEMIKSSPIIRHHLTLALEIKQGNVCQIQLGTRMSKGLLEPSINLMNISQFLDLCIEHTEDPVKCFAERASLSCKKKYISVEEYQQTWLPILAMEAATNAVAEGDPITVHNVPVKMHTINDQYSGVFELSEKFCKHRHITLMKKRKEHEEYSQDYLCLKCCLPSSHTSLPEKTRNTPMAKYFMWRNMWVAHAKIKHVTCEEQNITVEFDVKQHNSNPPKEVNIGKEKNYTLEYIKKTLPDRRMEAAVSSLNEASEFCKKIILGQPINNDNDNSKDITKVPEKLDIILIQKHKELPRNNDNQLHAIRMALRNKFSIIQGPPGTGKTLTAVKLMYWFTHMNHAKGDGSQRQVMYCGPSNSAVDVAVKQLTYRLGEKCPKIVRVYSEMLENQVFPIPRDTVVSNVKGRKYQLIGKKEQESTALHYLIRKSTNSFSARINVFDKRFKEVPAENITDDEIEKYQKLIADASIEELPKYDIILCTCTVSASPRVKRGTNIYQCIIDECGMCMEPETIIPMVTLKPKQIVLIGDHKQLRPIVKNQTAKDLGLDISMFERQILLRASQSIMLNRQYRMHKQICAFPSLHFYDNALETEETIYNYGVPDRIWPNQRAPVVFCHVKGIENSLSVATDEGNEQSKWNEAEVDHVVRIYSAFVNEYHVKQHTICVLSQYKAQCKAIERRLQENLFEKPNVSTVVASQGDEWDYVILSTVRSLPDHEIDKRPTPGWLKRNLGFIVDHNQINVALTRARRGLIIIGNQYLLQCDKDVRSRKKNNQRYHQEQDDNLNKESGSGLWCELLKFYRRLKPECVVNAEDFPVRPDALEVRERLLSKSRYTSQEEAWRYKKERLEFRPLDYSIPDRLQKAAQRKY